MASRDIGDHLSFFPFNCMNTFNTCMRVYEYFWGRGV